MKTPIRVAVTGAAGQIGYSLLFRIASGAMFGPDQPVALRLIEIEPGMAALGGVCMELDDCAFPLLHSNNPTSDINEGAAAPVTDDAVANLANPSDSCSDAAPPNNVVSPSANVDNLEPAAEAGQAVASPRRLH